MPKYTPALSGFMNDNAKGKQQNNNAPDFRSSGSGKSAIVTLVDIPKGSVISFGGWKTQSQYGESIQLRGQLVEPDHMPNQNHSAPNQSAPDFDDSMPF